MNLISKVKKLSILSVVVLNTLLLSGGLTINAMNPQSSNGSTSNVVVPYSKSIIDCVSQSTSQLGGVEPIAIFAYNSTSFPRGEIEIGIPQVVFSPNVKKIELVRRRIVLAGKLVPANSSDSVITASTAKILAYIPSKERLKARLFNEPIYIYIPQLVCRGEGERPWFMLVPQPIDFVGMPISANALALKIRPSDSSQIIVSQRGPGQHNESPQKKHMDAQANQSYAAPLNSSGFLPTPSSVEFSNTVSKNQQPSVSENPSPSLPSFSYLLKSQAEQPSVSKNEESNNPSASKSESLIGKCIERHLRFIRDLKNIDSSRKSVISKKLLETPQSSTPLSSEQTKQTNCVTPEKNKLSAKEMAKIGSLAPRPVRRHISKLSCDEIGELSKKLDFSQDESERQNTSVSSSNAQSEQKNYVTPERNKLSLQNSVSKSNGVQKTTVQNSQKPIHREAKKPMKTVDDKSPIHINLSDSQSDIETDIDTDIEENSDYNKK